MPKQLKRVKTNSPSMNDVARVAGVSQTTVSFVVNNVANANIPEETQERVWTAIKELGYRPNAMARSLRSQRSDTIGFISDEIVTTPYAGKIIQGAQDSAWANNKMLLVLNTSHNTDIEHVAVEMLLERRVESIIYGTMFHQEVTPPMNLRHVPMVLLNCYTEDRSLPSVVPDEVLGGRTAVEMLLQKGHTRIGFINSNDPIPATFGRLEGYKQALAAHNISFDPQLVCAEHRVAAGGYRATFELMRLPDPPTAIFCFRDLMAMGVYDALRKLGLSIPEDVAVVGFDNQELIAAHLHPSLSTLELPHYAMGQWAVQYLLDHADQLPVHAPTQHLMACPYIERLSA